MLTSNTLAQLSELKKEIRSSKNLSEGIVRGSTGRYGFVTLDDGRDVYLNSEMMDKVFQGDRVEVSVNENDRQQLEGKLEKLIQSSLKRIAGQYRIKGKGHFVAYFDNGYTRWIFVPPKERANSQDGDYVTAKITQHPFNNGKPQAKILKNLGKDTNAQTIRQLAITQHQLFDSWSKEVIDEANQLKKQDLIPIDKNNVVDLTHYHFVTIDAPSTMDMDDAVTIEAHDKGWTLWVAIASPANEIKDSSSLYKTALQRAHTLYFPGKPLPMLPEVLSTERYSLLEGKSRLTLVCKLDISEDGKTENYEFIPAIIESKTKLSYQQAYQLITEKKCESLNICHNEQTLADLLRQLSSCAERQHQHRKQACLVLENRPDFSLRLNKKGQLETIELIERNAAHQIIEEAMVATNRCAGEFLAKHNVGLFTTHSGFKEERRADIEKLFSESLQDDSNLDTTELKNYVSLIKTLQKNEEYALLLSKQQRFQNSSELSTHSDPHFGLGFEYYATVTSPIRRFQDLYNQSCILKLLSNQSAPAIKRQNIEKIKNTSSINRQACKYAQLWLISDFMKDKIGQEFEGRIALLTNQGIGVRLIDSGIEGFIAATKADKKQPDKPFDKISFNNQRLELSWNQHELNLDQKITVRLSGIDEKSHKLAFEWAKDFSATTETSA